MSTCVECSPDTLSVLGGSYLELRYQADTVSLIYRISWVLVPMLSSTKLKTYEIEGM